MHGPTTGVGLPGARLDPPGPDGRDAEATLNIYQGLRTFMMTDGEGKGGGHGWFWVRILPGPVLIPARL